MQAKEIMTKDVVSVTPDTSVEDVAKLLVEKKIAGVPVVAADGSVQGIVSESDLMCHELDPKDPGVFKLFIWGLKDEEKVEEYRHIIEKKMAATAGKIMTKPAIAVDAGDDVADVGQLMLDKRIKRVIVTQYGKLVGIISRADFVRMLVEKTVKK